MCDDSIFTFNGGVTTIVKSDVQIMQYRIYTAHEHLRTFYVYLEQWFTHY